MNHFMSPIARHAFSDPWLLAAASLAAAVTIACLVGLVACRLAARRPAPLRAGILLATLAVALLAPAATAVSALAGWGLMAVAAPATSPDVKLTSPTGAPAAGTDAAGAAIETEPVSHAAATATEPRLLPAGGTWLPSWRMLGSAACWAWLVGSAVAGGLLVLDLVKLARFRRTLEPCGTAEAATSLDAAARSVGLRRRPRLCESAAAAVPLVAGPLAPVVVLPRGLAPRLSADRLAAVLVHESAHVAHGDLWVAMLQRLAAVAFWWCPPLHRLNRQLADVREDICDNHVVRAQGHGVALAEALIELAANLPAGRRLAPCTIGTLAERPGVVGRVERLVRCGRREAAVRMSLLARWGTCCVAALAIGAVAATTLRAAAPAAADPPKVEPETAAAIDAALEWIVAQQDKDGGWTFSSRPKDRVEATSLAILPFLGRGYTHKRGPYKNNIERGLNFLVKAVTEKKDEAHAVDETMYAWGLAGLVLSEVYAMTEDQRLQKPAQLTLDFIMDAQDPLGGGWGHRPKEPGDLLVSGWQFMALKSGNLAGTVEFDPRTVQKFKEFLDSVEGDDGASYSAIEGGRPSPTSSAIGLLCRKYMDWRDDDPALQPGVAGIAEQGPGENLSFDYFATMVMNRKNNGNGRLWDETMKAMLLRTQAKNGPQAGSWHDGWKTLEAREADRLYHTSLATMILERVELE